MVIVSSDDPPKGGTTMIKLTDCSIADLGVAPLGGNA